MHTRHLFAAILATPLLLFITCRPFLKLRTEAERIRKEAQQLYDDANKMLPSSIKEAAETGLMAVDEALNISLPPQAVRFIAVTTATKLSHEAVRTIMLKQARKFDRVFGTKRTGEISTMLLNTYCYPLLDDIITTAVDRGLARLDVSLTGETTAPPIDTVIAQRLASFNLDNAVAVIKGFGTERKTPEYLQAVDRLPVNSATYAATRNWMDRGLVYQYRIREERLELKRSDGNWEPLPLPHNKVPRIVAADNNRCFVLTTDNELWWYCALHDQAQWSIDIMQTAVELLALKPVVGEELCSRILPHLTRITDSVTARAAAGKNLGDWITRKGYTSAEYWDSTCRAWTTIALGLDKLLLKTGDGTSFTAENYAAWSEQAHRAGAWSNLLSWTGGPDLMLYRGSNVPVDSITDIAIGHWPSTVVTMYVLAMGKVWFIDEEIIHPEWKPIEHWNNKWSVVAKEYHPIDGSPYPLDSTCRIDASNSVIAVARPSDSGTVVSWVRWDYHQKDDFIYWPLDWCEHRWHTAKSPAPSSTDFHIATLGATDPRESNTVWSIPAPAFTFHNYLPNPDYKGIFGDIPREQVSAYPVELCVDGTNDTTYCFTVKEAKQVVKGKGRWVVE